jgi:hypothetical protein
MIMRGSQMEKTKKIYIANSMARALFDFFIPFMILIGMIFILIYLLVKEGSISLKMASIIPVFVVVWAFAGIKIFPLSLMMSKVFSRRGRVPDSLSAMFIEDKQTEDRSA